jgi:transposase-like protein
MSATEVTNMNCLKCGRDFNPNREWQKFCCKECQQRWNRDQYRSLKVQAELELKGNGHLNGNASVEDEHRAKWAAIRTEWAEEDRQAAQPKFVRRF